MGPGFTGHHKFDLVSSIVEYYNYSIIWQMEFEAMYIFPERLAIVNIVNKQKLPSNIIFHLLVVNLQLHI